MKSMKVSFTVFDGNYNPIRKYEKISLAKAIRALIGLKEGRVPR